LGKGFFCSSNTSISPSKIRKSLGPAKRRASVQACGQKLRSALIFCILFQQGKSSINNKEIYKKYHYTINPPQKKFKKKINKPLNSKTMASNSETGDVKNIEAFKTIINLCESYAADYNPSANLLKLTNLQTQLSNIQNAQADLVKKQTTLNTTIDQRIKTFSNLKPLTTKLLNALIVSGADTLNIQTAKTLTRKIFGKRATPIQAPADLNQPTPITTSVSQLSYTNQVAHFSALTELLSAIAQYQPNETELQTAQLQTYIAQLENANTSVTQANTNYSNTKIIRNNQLYAPLTGIIDTAYYVKSYIKSLYGPSSKQYKQISGIKFTRKKE
jgi:hypothetical protein